jgi:hypothetical protein
VLLDSATQVRVASPVNVDARFFFQKKNLELACSYAFLLALPASVLLTPKLGPSINISRWVFMYTVI